MQNRMPLHLFHPSKRLVFQPLLYFLPLYLISNLYFDIDI
jgi:hypothetical protein